MDYRPFGNTGLQVSKLAFGASSLGSEFRSIDRAEGIRTVHLALERGVNYFDVAPYYGRTRAETLLGEALNGIARDRYILATKVGRYDADLFDFSAETLIRSVDESLRRLGVDYLDVIQCHDIEFVALDQIVDEALPVLRRLQEAGKVRFIGVTGLPIHIFRYIMERSEIDMLLSYCRYTLLDTSLASLFPEVTEKGIAVVNASPLAMRLLTRQPLPAWHPAPADMRSVCMEAVRFAESRGVDIAKLALQFSASEQRIATTVVGTASAKNMQQNLDWIEEPADKALIDEVRRILAPIADRSWLSGRPENNDPEVLAYS